MKGALALLLVAAAVPCAAQPRVTGGRLAERPAAGALAAEARALLTAAADPAWIAWEAPLAGGRDLTCCCTGPRTAPATGDGRTSARLEPPDTFFVFVRAEGGRADRVRSFGEGCELEAGGRAVTWLTGVRPAESVAFLEALAAAPGAPRRVVAGALSAVAQHGNPEAAPALLRLARHPDAAVRGAALFRVAQRAGEDAGAAITEAIANDPETEVRKRAVFALSQLPADEGVPRLIEVARSNRNPAVRRQAMFWLGQSRDARALAFFEEILK